jgi:hypothetical protein
MAPSAYGKNKWQEFTQESSPVYYEKFHFMAAPPPDGAFIRATAQDFRSQGDLNTQGFGPADLDRLPRPLVQDSTEKTSSDE